MKRMSTKKLVALALLSAIVAVVQFLGGAVKIGPVSISLVLIPIVVGAAVYGAKAGLWLGAVFGVVVLATDPFAATLWAINPFYTALICIGKGALAGWVAGLLYQLLKKKSTYIAALASAFVCPVVNTGLFCLGMGTMFYNTLLELAGGTATLYFLFVVMVGINFVVELGVNLLVSPIIPQISKAVGKQV